MAKQVRKPLTAKEAYELALKNQQNEDKRIYERLRQDCYDAVTECIERGEFSTDVSLKGDEGRVLSLVVDELRELGYKFAVKRYTQVAQTIYDKPTDEALTITIPEPK